MKTLGIPAIDNSKATHIIASDEVGYGCLAGPLSIGVVCAPRDWKPPEGLTDSKKLSWPVLTRLSDGFDYSIKHHIGGEAPFFCKVFTYDVETIDRMGIGKLLRWAHEVALDEAATWARIRGHSYLMIADGNMKIDGAISLPKADLLVPACSMASVVAKVHRDRLMHGLAASYPGYNFESNVGYDSPDHRAGLEKLGPCDLHRRSFSTYDEYKKPEEATNMWEMFGDD